MCIFLNVCQCVDYTLTLRNIFVLNRCERNPEIAPVSRKPMNSHRHQHHIICSIYNIAIASVLSITKKI